MYKNAKKRARPGGSMKHVCMVALPKSFCFWHTDLLKTALTIEDVY